MMNNNYHYMHIWLVEKLYGYNVFAKSQFFPTAKEYILFNYKVGWKLLRRFLQLNPKIIIINPIKLIKESVEINMIIQEPDTQDVHNRGHG